MTTQSFLPTDQTCVFVYQCLRVNYKYTGTTDQSERQKEIHMLLPLVHKVIIIFDVFFAGEIAS